MSDNPDLLQRMRDLDRLLMEHGLSPSDIPFLAFPLHEVREIFAASAYIQTTAQEQAPIENGSRVNILGFNGYAIISR